MRSDGDTWDIVSSVGRTALGVATFRAIESERPDAIIKDDYARLFVDAAGDRRFIEIMADPNTLGTWNFFPHTVGPRTKFFDDFFTSATDAGVRQAVIVAAGLDARAYRLDWPAGSTVFEIDQPTVLEFKNAVLAEHSIRPHADRRIVAVDLRDDWPAALLAQGFDATAPTAWSAEGLLPYLPGAAQDALFARIDTLSAPGTRLAAHGGPGDDIRTLRDATRAYFDTHPCEDQPPFDLFYDDERADPTQWLLERGWSVETFAMADLLDSYRRTLPELPADLPPELVGMLHLMSFWTASKP